MLILPLLAIGSSHSHLRSPSVQRLKTTPIYWIHEFLTKKPGFTICNCKISMIIATNRLPSLETWPCSKDLCFYTTGNLHINFKHAPNEHISKPPYYTKDWQIELGHTIMEAEYDTTLSLTHSTNIISTCQEWNFNTLIRWWGCSFTGHWIFPFVWPMLEVWHQKWGPWHIYKFSGPIYWLIHPILDLYFTNIPSCYRLTTILNSRVYSYLLYHIFFILAVRTLIPRYWKSPTTPPITTTIY